MKFHLIALTLAGASIYLFYIFIFGFRDDLADARSTIRKESVATAKDTTKINTKPELKPLINKVLTEPRREITQMVASNPYENPPTVEQPPVEQEIFQSHYQEKAYWCKNVQLRLDNNPVKCVYPDACYGCDDAIIPPEIPTATPLCVDGTPSKLYHVECCPSIYDGAAVCPSVEQCFNAEEVPKDSCKCHDSPTCRIAEIDGKIDCICDE